MEITGTVSKVIRRRTDHGSAYLTVDVDGTRLRYLAGFEPAPKRGDKVTIAGMPMVGFKRVNIGGVRVTIHDSAA